jgi:hypothetical protein
VIVVLIYEMYRRSILVLQWTHCYCVTQPEATAACSANFTERVNTHSVEKCEFL